MNTTPSFTHTLRQRWQAADSMLCVGLDPDPARIPAHLGTGPEAIDRFCRDIIAATADTTTPKARGIGSLIHLADIDLALQARDAVTSGPG